MDTGFVILLALGVCAVLVVKVLFTIIEMLTQAQQPPTKCRTHTWTYVQYKGQEVLFCSTCARTGEDIIMSDDESPREPQ